MTEQAAIKKAFASRKDIKVFKDNYSSGEIETEVISNLIQPYHQTKYPQIKDYCDFLFPQNSRLFKVVNSFRFMVETNGAQALQESFGKCDFKFDGNRTYSNYVLSFEGLTIVAPAKREVVIDVDVEDGFIAKLIRFEQAYMQFVVDFIIRNKEKMDKIDIECIESAKSIGLLDDNNKINFNINQVKSTKTPAKP